MIMELQVLPAPSGTADDTYAHVDAAIALIVAETVFIGGYVLAGLHFLG